MCVHYLISWLIEICNLVKQIRLFNLLVEGISKETEVGTQKCFTV